MRNRTIRRTRQRSSEFHQSDNNCMVPGNKPKAISKSHQKTPKPEQGCAKPDCGQWDEGYKQRVKPWGTFVICEPMMPNDLSWNAPVITEEILQRLEEWRSAYPALKITVRESHKGWRQQYHMIDGKPMPFDSGPKAAWKICLQRSCT